jgi:hypothetical protein
VVVVREDRAVTWRECGMHPPGRDPGRRIIHVGTRFTDRDVKAAREPFWVVMARGHRDVPGIPI